jgi:N-acetylneuraminic acid mutarotase
MPRAAIVIGSFAVVLAVAIAFAGTRTVSPAPGQPAGQPTTVEVAGMQSESNWREFAPKLKSNSEIAIAQLDNLVFVIGGYPSTRVFEDTVEIYDARTDSWQFGPALPQSMHHTMAVGINGKVYVIGGETSTSGLANQGIYLDTVYEYDPANPGWTQKSSMPTQRSAGAWGIIDGKIYLAGGRPPHGHDFAVYDPAADAWTVLPDLPTQRNHLAAGAIGGKLYVAGGRFGGGVGSEMTAIVEVYDPATNTWGSRAPMPTPRGGVNGIAVNGCLYTFGGEGNDDHPFGVFEQTEVYNPVTDSWSSLEPIPIPVHGVTGLAFIDGWIHLAGGGIMRGGSSGSTLHQAFRAYMSCE